MKRIISFLLSVCLVLGLFPVTVKADDVQIKYLKVSVNEELKTYECLWDNDEIYCSVENLAEISNYDWEKTENSEEYTFVRNYDTKYGLTSQVITQVRVRIDSNRKVADIETMGENYSVSCYYIDSNLFLPLEKLLYLLHTEWMIEDDIVCVTPMPLTILDFIAIHEMDLVTIASQSEDVLINTGWLFSDTELGQATYSAVAEVFSDFDGKIFMLWWPGEGNVEVAECYENAILQLAKEDKEFVGEDVQQDALSQAVNSIFYLNNKYFNKIKNIADIPKNINNIVKSVPDAIEILENMGGKTKKLNTIAKKVDNIQVEDFPIDIPDGIGDGLALLQCVWNAYDTASRVKGWNEEYLAQLQVLADYQEFGCVNDSVAGYVRTSAQRLIDSYQNPGEAAANEAIQSTLGLLLSKTFDASPFGKAFSIMGAVGSCYGVFNVDAAEAYDMYAELQVVSFSVKIEQMIKYLLDNNGSFRMTNKLTDWEIEDYRNQLMLYLRLNLRNKAQLYNLNVKGNEDRNWIQSQEAKELYNEIVLVYTMLAELIETKDYDSFIILDNEWDMFNSADKRDNVISDEILFNEKIIDVMDYFDNWHGLLNELDMNNNSEDTTKIDSIKDNILSIYYDSISNDIFIGNGGDEEVSINGIVVNDNINVAKKLLQENSWFQIDIVFSLEDDSVDALYFITMQKDVYYGLHIIYSKEDEKIILWDLSNLVGAEEEALYAKQYVSEGWKKAYIDFIMKQGPTYDELYNEMEEYKLVNINGDNIPELYINEGGVYGMLCAYFNDTLISLPIWSYGFSYFEGQNLFMNSRGRMDVYSDEIYKIENGEFVLLQKGDYGATDNSNVQVDAEGCPIYEYYWNDVKLSSETEYQNLLYSVYDEQKASRPYDGVEYDNEQGRYVGNGICNYSEILMAIMNY